MIEQIATIVLLFGAGYLLRGYIEHKARQNRKQFHSRILKRI